MLLVEDNPGDAELAREAFADSEIVGDIHAVPDGVEALAFLRRATGYDDAPRPDLVLLDLNLPRVSGHEVLASIRQDAALRDICVIVFSSSAAPDDRGRAQHLGADAYVTKAVDLDAHLAAVRSVERVWRGRLAA